MAEFLQFEGISKRFGNVRAVDGVSLGVGRGEFFSLLGPSGCGKTTLLRLVAGFEQPDSGRILLDGQDITAMPPHRRSVNTVFQSYALFPHLSVRENIAFGLRVARRPRREIDLEVDRMLSLIQMEGRGDRKPDQISGGQKQRVALARALVLKPRVLLLDEPLAALDLKLRQRMLLELDLIHDQVGITFLYVTHDQGEAMSLSDRIAVMENGRIDQVGTPVEVYETPQSSFVAAFIGDTNFFDGIVSARIDEDLCRLEIPHLGAVLCCNDKQKQPGDRVHLSLRPEKFRISAERPADTEPNLNVAEGVVEDIVYAGNHTRFWVRVGALRLSVYQQHRRVLMGEKTIRWGDRVWLRWYADGGYMLDQYHPEDDHLLQVPPAGLANPTGAAGSGNKGAAP